jgi:hypothetical protein
VAAAAAAAALLGCQEDLTMPGRCPELCPPDLLVVLDTLLTGVVATDTSIQGYNTITELPILVASDVDSFQALAVLRFQAVPERWFPTGVDTAGVRVGTIDSVAIQLRMDDRDTAAKDVRILVYRSPVATADSGVTYADVESLLTDAQLVDSMPVNDTLVVADVQRLLPVAAVTPQEADSNKLAFVLAVRASSRTVVTLASSDPGGVAPLLTYYVHGAPPLDTFSTRLVLVPEFDTYVTSPPPSPPAPGAIVVGGQPAARSFVRFSLPSYIGDSVTVLRATLMLTPRVPPVGRPGELFNVVARPVLRYFGGKSPLIPDTTIAGRGTVTSGDTSVVSIEMAPILRAWRGVNPDTLPRVVVLRNQFESQSLGGLDAVGQAGGAAAPRLRVTYLRPREGGVP